MFFDDVFGQDHIVTVLKNQCSTGKTSHAYLFCGSRGTGKTTAAKILAKAVNCLDIRAGNPCGVCQNCLLVESGAATDINEIDAASNNSVDNIRDLRDEVVYVPAALKKRVYIIDEVHMLSTSAFNALLKTLEEPPENVVFILATTELNKIPATILSRCQRFEFRRIDSDIIRKRIQYYAEKEGIKLETEAAELIARLADGGMRDALSMLESCSAGNSETGKVDLAFVQDRLGVSGSDSALLLLENVAKKNVSGCISIIAMLHSSAKDLNSFLGDLLRLVRDILVLSRTGDKNTISSFLSDEETDRLSSLSKTFKTEELLYFSTVLEDTFFRLGRYSSNKRFELEMTAIKLCDTSLDSSPAALAARISVLESGSFTSIKREADKQSPQIQEKDSSFDIESSANENIQPDDSSKEAVIAEQPKGDNHPVKFPDVKKFLEKLKKEPQLYALAEVSSLRFTEKGLTIGCDPFVANMLSQKTSLIKLEDALKELCGEGFTITISGKKEVVNEEKSSLDDLKIY